ncbi:hypothetical protein D3C71_1604270 [compost metagenome]
MKKLGISGWGLIIIVGMLSYLFFKDPMKVGYIHELKELVITAVLITVIFLIHRFVHND